MISAREIFIAILFAVNCIGIRSSPVLAASGDEIAATSKSRNDANQAPPEMRVDPSLLDNYRDVASREAKRVENADVQFVLIEPSLEFHQFETFSGRSDYFELPLNGDGQGAVIPRVWIGHPTGAVWSGVIRARAGFDFSYFSHDGAQNVHHRGVDLDFKDNVSTHALPLIFGVRLNTAEANMSFLGVSPWISAGAGIVMTQFSGSLDGLSQLAWTPVRKTGAGLRYAFPESTGLAGGFNLGFFSIAGSSSKVVWRGEGVAVGADIKL